jgi:Ca2+/Na+ antiporter
MALATFSPDFVGTGPAAALAVPTTTEVADVSGGTVFLIVVIGGTATTVTTSIGPKDNYGRTQAVLTTGAVTSSTRVLRLTRDMGDANGQVTITFSQVTAVTAVLLRP